MSDSVSRSGAVGATGVAVVGTGSIGTSHLRLLREAGVATLVAVPVRSQRRAQLESEGLETAGSLEEIEGRVGAAIVATDTRRHPHDACRALSLGCHVLVEKPLAVDAPAGECIRETAEKTARGAYVGCLLRYSASVNGFRDRVPSLGRIHSVRIECQSYLPHWRPDRPYRDSYSARSEDGGVLRDLIHEIDYAGWIFGWPKAVRGRTRNLGRLGIESEEAADLEWVSDAGCLVSISLDYLSPVTRRRMRATGEHGSLEWDGLAGTVTVAHAGSEPKIAHWDQTRDGRLRDQDLAFLDACRGQVDPRLATCTDGLKALSVCDAARRSSISGREEQVTLA